MTLHHELTAQQSATIYMQPFGKARPRVTRAGHAYMPDSYTAAKQELQLSFGAVTVPPPWVVTIQAYRQIPKSCTKAQRAEMDDQYCLTKPDADNIAGAVMDALFPDDDSEVVAVSCSKRWAERGALVITVASAEGYGGPPF